MAKKDVSDAAQKVAKAEKATAKASNKSGKPGFLKRAGKAIPKFFKDFKGEIKKIVWPDLKTVVKSTGVVLLSVLIIGVFIWIADFGLTKGIDSLRHLASSHSSSATEQTDPESDVPVEDITAAGEVTEPEKTAETTTIAESTTAAETTEAAATTAAAETTEAASAATTKAE
ncbi:MAG: preprotein translocase subunit SecE [Clostridiales bacterium]|nr:preprotein translocase subunit SecE [Clostridiales bacterium]